MVIIVALIIIVILEDSVYGHTIIPEVYFIRVMDRGQRHMDADRQTKQTVNVYVRT